VRAIVRQARSRDYGLASLVLAVAQSDPFQQRGTVAPARQVVARE
jgi:hypothetical protein